MLTSCIRLWRRTAYRVEIACRSGRSRKLLPHIGPVNRQTLYIVSATQQPLGSAKPFPLNQEEPRPSIFKAFLLLITCGFPGTWRRFCFLVAATTNVGVS